MKGNFMAKSKQVVELGRDFDNGIIDAAGQFWGIKPKDMAATFGTVVLPDMIVIKDGGPELRKPPNPEQKAMMARMGWDTGKYGKRGSGETFEAIYPNGYLDHQNPVPRS